MREYSSKSPPGCVVKLIRFAPGYFTRQSTPLMVSNRILFGSIATLLLTAATSPLSQAATLISGASVYTENFDSLSLTTIPWLDDSTLPGWSAEMNANGTADGNLQVTDGTGAVLSGLLNLGSLDATDRALGSKATGTASGDAG